MLSRVLLQVLRNSLTALLHSNEPCCFRLPHHQTLFAAGDSAAPDNVTSASAAAAQQLTCGCKLRQNLDTSAISRLNEVTTTRFFQPGSLDIQQCSAAAEVSSCSHPDTPDLPNRSSHGISVSPVSLLIRDTRPCFLSRYSILLSAVPRQPRGAAAGDHRAREQPRGRGAPTPGRARRARLGEPGQPLIISL